VTTRTPEEFSAMLGSILWRAIEKLATQPSLSTLNTISHLLWRIPSGTGNGDALSHERERVRTKLREVALETLERPEVRAQVRELASRPKRAKRYRRMLDLVLRERPNVFTEAATEPVDKQFVDNFDKSQSGGWITVSRTVTHSPQSLSAEARSVEQIRADCASDFRECIPRLKAIAEDPNAKPADRRKAARLLRQYAGAVEAADKGGPPNAAKPAIRVEFWDQRARGT
jgi:hypothetical protein